MSQSYVIRVSASVREVVATKDRRRKTIALSKIVPAAEQRELLRAALRAKGWEEEKGSEGKVLRRRRGRVVERVDLEELTVEAEVELAKTLERSRTITVRGDRDFEDEEERRRREQASLERSLSIRDEERAAVESELLAEIARELEETDAERDAELNEAVREVYAESLKRKARSLGTVTSVREHRSGDDYELVIKITE
ncbi:MAG: hypothetical protein D6731_14760 [Planctomycetota bacterium]|nr:MAG: hypothetical protein D6731_14760 [Planctomycetota bacterium]